MLCFLAVKGFNTALRLTQALGRLEVQCSGTPSLFVPACCQDLAWQRCDSEGSGRLSLQHGGVDFWRSSHSRSGGLSSSYKPRCSTWFPGLSLTSPRTSHLPACPASAP